MREPNHRCKLCALPMEGPGQTGYCSERCLVWDTLGVPALMEDQLITEILANQRRSVVPDGWQPQPAYPALDEYYVWRKAKPLIIESLAPLHTDSAHAR